MRILHAISGIEPENGGPTAALIGLCRALKKQGAEVSIVATWKADTAFSVAESLRAGGIDVTLLGPTSRPFRSHPKLRETLAAAAARADVVHIHAMWEAIEDLAAVVARGAGKPYVWTPHGMLDRWNMRRNRLFKKLCLAGYLWRDLARASLLHVASEFEREQVGRHKLPAPVKVLGLGVNEEVFADATPVAAPGATSRRPTVLFLGRVQRGKGLELLIPAMARLHRPATLVVAGPDEGAQPAMATLARSLGVADRVQFVGMLAGAQKMRVLRESTLLAAPSQHENFGIAVAEALAVGTPVVVSDQVGLASLVTQHDLGRVTPLNPGAIAAAIEELLTPDPARSQRCRTVARETFDWDRLAVDWITTYGGLLK